MPNATDHIALANKNDEALRHLLDDYKRFPEWVTTIAFYKAVHVVETLFSNSSKHSSDHRTRLNILGRTYPRIYREFRVLHTASQIARYLSDSASHTPYTSFCDYLTPEKVVSEIINKRLLRLEQVVIAKLEEDQRKVLKKIQKIDL